MRHEPHPISGATYREVGDGLVRVEDQARDVWGVFRYDGAWLEGPLHHADPNMLHYVGGPDLPPGKDVYWGMMPPIAVDEPEPDARATTPGRAGDRPPVIGAYRGDPGKATAAGARSSAFIDQDFFLDNDRRPDLVPEAFRAHAPMTGGPARVPTARFFEPRFHALEVEHIWKRCWQMACREDDIPEVGDHLVYTVADLSFIIVRTGGRAFKVHVNACLHRGRQLCEHAGRGARMFRCPYHGWSWTIDGALKEITTEWDFPGVREDVSELPGARVATWGGFVFINPSADGESLEEFLGPVMLGHYAKFRFENRYKQAHVARVMPANWKVVMEAFMESYHVIATHPQMLLSGGDLADVRYDVFGNFGRGGHAGVSASSPQRGMMASNEEALARYRAAADLNREYLRGLIGAEVEQFSDAELNDVSFNDVFPNLHPWGGWGRMVFRFRPLGSDPERSTMDIMMLAPWPADKPKPPAVALRHLAPGEPWTRAPELGAFARILDQDVFNLERLQRGLNCKQPPYVWYSAYQEGKIRNFHRNYEARLGI